MSEDQKVENTTLETETESQLQSKDRKNYRKRR